MKQETLQETYKSYAKWYDFTFGKIIQPGRKKVIEKLNCQSGDKILEVGVGTGLSLPLYPKSIEITGVDLSEDMLNLAKERVAKQALTNINLLTMNAEEMAFEDNQFDKVVALYVASVVPNPDKLVSEMRRVCKPGGELFIVNHFYNKTPVIGTVERLISPFLCRMFGFQPCVKLEEFVDKTGIQITEKAKVNFMGNWTFLRIKNTKPSIINLNNEAIEISSVNVDTISTSTVSI